MSWNLLKADQANLAGVELRLNHGIAGAPPGALGGSAGVAIQFQFPPLVKSDNKHIEWDEADVRNIEPLVMFKGSKPREISLEWCYVVTGSSTQGNKTFTAQNVAKLIKTIRQYFYATMFSEYKQTAMVILFRAYEAIGSKDAQTQLFSFRSTGVDVKYSDTLINDNGYIFPLRTDISMKLCLLSNLEDKNGKPMMKLPWLVSAQKLTLDWY